MSVPLSARAVAQKAREEGLAEAGRAFLALHGWTLNNGVPGTYEVSRCCKSCGRELRGVLWFGSQPRAGGGPALSLFLDEESRAWRLEIRRANDDHHQLFVRSGGRCPVVAFALVELRAEIEAAHG